MKYDGSKKNARQRKNTIDLLRRADWFMPLESRVLLSAAFDVTGITALRQDASLFGSNGQTLIDGRGVTVALLDTGGYALNPDLQGNFLGFYDAVTQPESAALVTDPTKAFDHEGHGSHTTGIAASTNPNIGVAYAAKFIDVRVFADANEAQLSGDPLLRGLDWVYAHAQQYNIKVVNMSLGDMSNFNSLPGTNDEYQIIQSLQAVGVTVVSSSGNDYADFAAPGQADPAVFSTISVANTWATDGTGHDFNFYMYGSDSSQYAAVESDAAVDRFSATSQRSTMANQVAAPGVDIYSTWNNSSTDGASGDLMHNTLSGTSMSAPLVSGIVALMQEAAQTYGGRYLQPSEVLSILRATAQSITDSNVATNGRIPIANGKPTGPEQDLPETGQTFERVDAYAAVLRVRQIMTGGAVVPPNQPPGQGSDANNTTATALTVPSLNGTATFAFTGNIGNDGSASVGADDVDLFKITLTSPGNLIFSLLPVSGGTAFAAALRVFDASGAVIGSTTGTAADYPGLQTNANSPLAPGVYYIGVSATGNVGYNPVSGSGTVNGTGTGDYVLNISLNNPDPNGTAQGATVVNLTAPDSFLPGSRAPANGFAGLLGSDPPPLNSSQRIAVPNGDVDMFKVVAPDTGSLTVDTEAQSVFTSSVADTYLRVFDANLNQIAFNDDKSASNTDSQVRFNVIAGQTYYVAVTNYTNRNFAVSDPYAGRVANSTLDENYDVFFSFDNGDANGNVFNATAASVGTTINDSIGADGGTALSGADGGAKDVDFYKLTMPSAGLFDFQASYSRGGAAPVVTFWQPSANPNADPNDLFGANNYTKLGDSTGSNGHLIMAVTAGQVLYVSISGAGNSAFNYAAVASGSDGQTGAYSATVAILPTGNLGALEDNSINASTPQNINLDQGITEIIGQDGPLIVGPTDVDVFRFVAPQDMVVAIRTNTSMEGSADTVLRLFDAAGHELTFNDNADATTSSSKISYAVTAGQTYYIGVSGGGPDSRAYNPLTGAGAGAGTTGVYGLIVTGGSPNERFVNQTYEDLLGRTVDAAGLGVWAGQLNNGLARADFVQAINSSTEYRTGQITAIYERLLKRAPDANGLSTFLTAMSAGTTLRQIEATLAGSGEYANLHPGDRLFPQAIYQDLFGRTIDSNGMTYVEHLLAAGQTNGEVATTLLNSQEFLQNLVNSYFERFLRRGVDPTGLNYFVSQLQQGATEGSILAYLIGSDEYYVAGAARNGSPTEKYVDHLYEDLLGRLPDATGLETWTVRLDLGRDRSSVAQSILASAEYQAIYVGAQYQAILGRGADAGGVNYFVSQMAAGTTNEQVQAALFGSDEFYARSGGSNPGFVDALYAELLGRSPDANGEAFFNNQLNGGATRTSLTMILLTSTEYRTDLLQQYYHSYLHRAATDPELTPLLSGLNAGGTDQAALTTILSTDEYFG